MTDYDAIQALNWSTLKLLHVSPKWLQWSATHPREDTAALALGRAIHVCALEPERWHCEHMARPDFGDLRTKRAKALRVEWESTLSPRVTVLDAKTYELTETCARAVREHPEAMKLLAGGRNEETVQWTDELTGIRCKGRVDTGRPLDICDLKSTCRGTPREFIRDAAALLYHGQLAWYHDGAVSAGVLPPNALLPGIVAVQTTPPFDVMAFRMTENAYLVGRILWQSLIQRYAECQAAEWWPGVAPTLLDFDVPPWAPHGDEPITDEVF